MRRISGKGGRGQRADVMGGCLYKQPRWAETLPDTNDGRSKGVVALGGGG